MNGIALPHWADLSGYYATSDGGHIQFHCNFPHHAAGVVARLCCEPTRDSIQQAVLSHDPYILEQQLIDDGMIAAKLRTTDEWGEHPHARATHDLPLITVERLGDAPPRDPSRRLKVLDCSRVLAGPVAGATFAAHGADVLLVGAAHPASVEAGVLTTGFGKKTPSPTSIPTWVTPTSDGCSIQPTSGSTPTARILRQSRIPGGTLHSRNRRSAVVCV